MKHKLTMAAMIFCLIAGQLIGIEHGKAASCNVILSMEEESVNINDTFVVTVDIEGEETISGVEMMLTYDSDLLEYENGSPAVSGGEGSLKVSDQYLSSDSTTVRYLIKFRVQKAGVSYVKVNSNASVYNEASGQSMSVASNVLTVVGNAGRDTSDNNRLKTLKISGGTIQPEFAADITEYTATVDEGTEKLIVGAEAEDSNATVNVTGAEELKPGENKISIIVTAENGDTKEYTILANYEEKPEAEPTKEAEEEAAASEEEELEPIMAMKQGDSVVLTTYAQFTVEELTDPALLPKDYQSTTVLIDGCAVTAYQKPEEKSDFVLIFASKEGTEPTLYQYDKVENTLSRFNHLLVVGDATEMTSDMAESASTHSVVYDALLIGLVVLSLIFMGTSVIFYQKSRRRH